jgi:hypothetical protein
VLAGTGWTRSVAGEESSIEAILEAVLAKRGFTRLGTIGLSES